MNEYKDLARRLDDMLGNNRAIGLPKVSFEPAFNECSFKHLLESYFYLYLPGQKMPGRESLYEKVKETIQDFLQNNEGHFVVTTLRHCGSCDCYGHYIDPFMAVDNEHVFLNKFPEDLSGAHIHFLSPKNYRRFLVIQNPHRFFSESNFGE